MSRTSIARSLAPPRRIGGPTRSAGAVLLIVAMLSLWASGTHALLEIQVLDDLVAEQNARPSAADPGPIMHDASDGLRFSSGLSDIAAIWYSELVSVTNNASATQATIQGKMEMFATWFYGKQNSATRYASFNATGTYDNDAASYSVPLLFTQSSQGIVQIRSYEAAAPTDGGTLVTYYWAYDAGTNRYLFGASKDLSAALEVAPISATLGTTYTTTIETNQYVVATVGSAPDYLPTVKQGKHLALLDLPADHTWYLLMDPPAGVHEDTYDFTLQVTAQGL